MTGIIILRSFESTLRAISSAYMAVSDVLVFQPAVTLGTYLKIVYQIVAFFSMPK